MKNLQEAINNHVMNSRNHKRYLAALIAMSMLVSFMVPFLLIEPAVSLTNDSEISPQAAGAMLTNYANADGNDGYSPKERSEVELLVGNGVEWASDCTTASEVIEKAKEEYFLGIAYDFSLFLEGTATLKNADAEGRVAVGGNLIFTGGYCYQVGSGNFGYMTALKDTDDYQGITNFAHAIVGGYMKNIHPLSTGNNRMRINQLTTEKGGHQGYGETLYFPPTEDMFKRFVVGADINNDDFTHMHCSNEKYNANGSHDSVSVNELAEMYKQPEDGVINFTSTFEWLRERSIKLGEKTATGEATSNGNKVTFKIPDGMENAKTVYFDLPDNVDYSKLEEIRFENVPKDTTEMIVRETETDELKKITKNIPKCNLVINAKGTSFDIRGVGNTTKTIIKYTDNTEDEISNNIDLEKRDEYNKNDIHHNNEISNDNGAVVPCRSNNHPASSKILYNFPNAKTGTINGNFNGTIFAPDANIKSDDSCTGHLSGALIAKSFEGGLEFGYRPYRGTSDILGSNSGYVVPVDKLIKDTETYLPNASFTITDNNTNKIVDRWKSGDATEFVVIPSLVDFSGKINYNTETNQYVKTYTIAESSSPNGYIKTDKHYTVSVTETVNKDYLLKFGEGTIPQVVDVEIIIKSSDTEEANFPKTIRFQYRDSYKDTDEAAKGLEQSQRKVLVFGEDNTVSKVFALNINTVGGSQTVTQLGTIDNWTADCDVEITTTTKAVETTTQTVETTTQTVETTTEAIATENEISEEQNNDIQTESVPEVEPVNENANAADEVLSVQSADNAVTQYKKIKPIESQAITPDGKDLKSSWEFTDNNKRYYYDNNSMMVIPLPDSNLKFENKPGLLFTKVDKTTGEILEGAEISITPEYTGFDASSGSFLFDIENLGTGVYTLTENTAPAGYEKADSIHFKKDSDGKLYTCDSNGSNAVEMAKTNGYYAFSMEDIKISGVIPSLKKTDENDAILAGASFELWAKDGTSAICSWENFSGKETSMKEKLLTVTDTTYVVNGYLKPGVYYLEETVIPKKNGKDYYENPGKMYFTVNKDFTITNGYVDAKQLKVVQADPHEIKFGAEDGSVLNNITSITWESNGVKSIYDTDPTINDIDGNYHNNYTYTAKAFNQKSGNNYAFKLANWGDGKPNLEVYYVEVIADGQKYIYNNRPSNASLMALSSNDADKENGISPLAEGEIKELSLDKFEDNSSDRPIFKSKDGSKINNAKYIYVESNDSQVQIYNTDSSPWEGKKVNVRENKKPENANIASFNNIKLQTCNKWGNGFEVTYVRITAEDGTQYIYGTPSGDVPEPSDDGGGNTDGNTGDNPGGNTGSNGESIENPHLTVTDKLLTVKNTRPGDNKSITVEKVWEDGEFKSGRTDITIQLYRTTDTVDYNNLPTNDDANKVGDAVTLNASGDTPWKYTWSTLPSYVENSDDTWNYYVKEVSTPSGYTVQYSASGNEFKITNTLQKDEISITKKWENASETNLTKPTQLNVTLKFTVNNTQQTKTVTLTPKDGSEDYTGSYEIPKGATDVSVEENSVPPGWKLKENGIENNGNHFTITNVPDTTQLTVKKEWVNDTQSSRPQQIHFKLYRKVQSGGSSGDNADAPNFDPNDTDNLYPKNQTPEQVQEDYARLLQYSLYFYDANMCGSEVSEKSAFSKTNANGWRDDCHTYSGYVDGGYHDAGDHVMFGLPQGFTASTLGWSYYEFKDSYDTLGLTEHYKTIMKYFCDFFEKSIRTRNNTVEILVQKGDSSTDHNYWGAPETQSNYGSEIWVSDKGGNIAAQYAAALAQYSLNFPDDANSTSYLSKAIEFYNFATSHTTDYDVSNYDSKESADDIAWAAGWLYLATGKNNNDYLDKLNSCPNIDWLYNWNNVAMGAACLKAEINGDWSTVNSAIDSNFKNCNAKVGNYICLNDWGSARYSTLMQFVALVSDKNNNTETYKELCQGQMAYLLGDNSIESNGNTSTCFVTGFAPNSAKYPHHRAASGTSEAKTDKTKYQHQLVGALVGGPNTSGKYIDITDNGSELCYQVNEVALDYNAGLVGAAAGLYAAYGTGETYSNVPPAQKLRTKVGPMKLNFNVNVNVLDAADKNFIELTSDQINKLGNGLDVSSLCNGKFITKISIQFNNSGGCNVTLNDCQLHNGNFTENPLEICSNDNGKFEGCYGGEVDNNTLNTLKISGWGQTVTSVKLYYKVNEFQITSSKDIIIPVGSDGTITANSKIASWSPTDNSNITITQKSDTELNVRANSYTDQQPITITLTGEDGNTDTVDVRIQGSDFEVSDAKIRIGGTPLTVDGTLTITEGSEFISIKGNTITAVSEGTAKVNVTKDGVTKPMTIEVFGVFSADTMTINKGKTKDPKINNLIGELELTILESTPEVEGTTVLEITEDGKIKTLNNGTVRIKVEDSFDDSESEFTVTVKLTSELPELPADLNRTDDFVCEITLTKDDDWQQVLNLEKDDGNGHVYEYYVVEVNEKGDISDTNLISGNNSVKYYPFDYDNNGATLNNGDQTITVKNEASEKPDNPDYTLPNTGGIGTGGFTTAGGAIIIGSTALYILSKRRRKKNVVR